MKVSQLSWMVFMAGTCSSPLNREHADSLANCADHSWDAVKGMEKVLGDGGWYWGARE